MTTKSYTCVGSVRGCCGRVHKTAAAAEKCLARDQRGCRAQGGYSDRRVVPRGSYTYSERCEMPEAVRDVICA
jgi:hypothetical protein